MENQTTELSPALHSLSYFFSTITDPRRVNRGNFTHLLSDILLLTITALLCGADDWETVHIFGTTQEDWLKKYGDFEEGIPSLDTMRRVFSAIKPEEFNTCFISWMNHLCVKSKGEIIAVDGKTVKGAKFKDNITPHIVSAFASQNQLCLGQLKVDEKSNEITAIPELLQLLDIEDNIITIDAIGCRTKIVEQIIEGNGNYIIAVKDNQPTLSQNIQETITCIKPESISIQDDFGHGRIEKRTCEVYTDLSQIKNPSKWKNLSSVVKITSEVFLKSTGRKTIEDRFYISDQYDSKIINQGVRSHWSVENNLHWCLDVTFREDYSKKRIENQVENFNILLKIALTILKKEKSETISLKNKRLKAALNINYREKLMNTAVF